MNSFLFLFYVQEIEMSSTTQNNLSELELATYQAQKASWFKGTIAVCVVYGVFAIGLLAIALMDARGRQILSEDLLPFTITFVAGMIIVIILLVVQITTFKPQQLNNVLYDRETCPDYWKAVPATADDIKLGGNTDESAADSYLKKIKCVPDKDMLGFDYKWNNNKFDPISITPGTSATADKNVFNHSIINNQSGGESYNVNKNQYYVSQPATPTDPQTKLFTVAKNMYGNVGIGTNMRCDMIFPALLAKEDESKYPDNPSQLRCEYAKLCGINWSSVC